MGEFTGGSFYLTGTNTPDNTTLTPVYIPNATDIAQGFFQITVNSTGNGQCNPAVDTMTFFIRPLPVPSFKWHSFRWLFTTPSVL